MSSSVKRLPPGYIFDSRLMGGGRYRVVTAKGKPGQMVKEETITDLARAVADGVASRLALLAGDAVRGALSPAIFREAARVEICNAYTANAMLGAGGRARMTKAEHQQADPQVEIQAIVQLAQEIAARRVTAEQAAARARVFGSRAYDHTVAGTTQRQLRPFIPQKQELLKATKAAFARPEVLESIYRRKNLVAIVATALAKQRSDLQRRFQEKVALPPQTWWDEEEAALRKSLLLEFEKLALAGADDAVRSIGATND